MRHLKCCFALLLCVLLEGSLLVRSQDVIDVDGFIDTDACYDALITADQDGDRRVTADEYVTVVQLLGPAGFMDDATTFSELPFLIKLTFNALSCLCNSAGGASECCIGDNAHISNEGAAPGETPTEEQSAYLFTVCLATERSIDAVMSSTAPTTYPSETPSAVPTPMTSKPSVAPTVVPSEAPSAAPTAVTPAPTTVKPAPTTTPTSPLPTSAPPLPIEVTYVIQIPNGQNVPLEEQEVTDLEAAMGILAQQVADETFAVRVRRRRLLVTVETPTSITGTILAVCDPGTPPDTLCRDMQHVVELNLDGQDPEEAQATFTDNLNQAIGEGRLEEALVEVNPQSRIQVEANSVAPAPAPSPSAAAPEGLSAGASIGIAIAAVVTVLAAAGLFVARKKRHEKDDVYAAGTQALADSDQNARDAQDLKSRDASTLGASQADYGKKSKQAVVTPVVGFDSLEEDAKVKPQLSGEESSNAGSSGWSSSAGVSSLNTGSADSLEFGGGAAAAGATLAAIGAASALTRDTEPDKSEGAAAPVWSNVSRGDLDAAIEAGDWAAVGATAALLAAASDSPESRSHSSRSGRTSSSRGGSAVSSIDAARAAELDHLVDAGDWEGVVLAAAKFEASEEGSKGSSRSPKSGSLTGESKSIGGSTGGASSGNSPSMSDSESPSKHQKRAEIRAEVEALVRRVVPEEIDNVDEMMLQFKGREEELVETLRTMQERQVAQKARVQGQKAAKREARNAVQQGGVIPKPSDAAAEAEGLSPAEAAGVAAGAAAALGVAAGIAAGAKKNEEEGNDEPALVKEDSVGKMSSSESGTSTSGSNKRTALELAIEAGDWEAVGEAAAMMSDTSVTTASSSEVRALAAGIPSDDDESSDVRRMKEAGVNSDRAAELDAMIDRGDWTGVVAAASRYSNLDTQTTEDSSESDTSASEQKSGQQGRKRSWFGGSSLLDTKPEAKDKDQSMNVDAEKDADQARKEEEDALAQAEIWMAIANQSKKEGSTEDAGASDAADWAIARSLSALRSAEQRGELSQPDKDVAPDAGSAASLGEADSKGDRSV